MLRAQPSAWTRLASMLSCSLPLQHPLPNWVACLCRSCTQIHGMGKHTRVASVRG